MKKLLLSVAMLASMSAFAANRTYTDPEGNTAVLKDGPCQVEILKKLSFFDKLKDATLTIDGVAHKACYIEDSVVVVIGNEDGVLQIPVELFK